MKLLAKLPLAELASRLRQPNACDAGHPKHAWDRYPIVLKGQPRVSEYPAIPDDLSLIFSVGVYDARRYAGFPGYCTGQGDFSLSILENGCWEGYETLLALQILASGDRKGVVLDFGAHLGWYSFIAAKFGYRVAAFEGDAENAEVIKASASLQGLYNLITVVPAWLDKDFPELPANAERVRLLKADVEGSEDQVVRICKRLLKARKVDYLLLEVSPCFKPHYPETLAWVVDQGYAAFQIPDKGCAWKEAFEADPLGETMRRMRIDPATLKDYIRRLRQENFLLVRED